MESEIKKAEKHKQKIKHWLKSPENLALIGILLLAFMPFLYSNSFLYAGGPLGFLRSFPKGILLFREAYCYS